MWIDSDEFAGAAVVAGCGAAALVVVVAVAAALMFSPVARVALADYY